MKSVFIFIFLSGLTCRTVAQELLSLSNGNYAGINGADVNPSFIAYSRLETDINFLQFRGNIFNNNFYANSRFVPSLAFNQNQKGYLDNWQHSNYVKSDDQIIISQDINAPTNLWANAIVKGPGFMWSDGRKAFAVQSHFKNIVDVNNIDPQLSLMLFEQTRYQPYINQRLSLRNGAGLSMMNYGEVSFTYAKTVSNRKYRIVNFGVTGKLLVGFNALSLKSQGSTFQFPSHNNISASDFNMDVGYAVSDIQQGENFFAPKGTGAAADIGFSYIRKKSSRYFKTGCPSFIRKICFMPNYKWKFGASILDFGGITFNSRANFYQYRNASFQWNAVGSSNIRSIQQADATLQDRTVGTGSLNEQYSFYMALPTALSIQFDYNLNDAVFINATWVQRMQFSNGPGIRRMNVLCVSPRYETDQIELAMPISLYEYQYPTVGAMVRYGSVFIGSDQLGSTLGFARLNGADLYIGVKMNVHNNNSPGSVSAKKRKKPINLNG